MESFNPTADLLAALPLLVLLLTGLVAMLLDAFKAEAALPYLTGGGIILSCLLALPLGEGANYSLHFNRMIAFGGLASLNHIFLSLAAFFSIFFIEDYFRKRREHVAEAYALILFATIGMIMMANANDLVIVFIGLEIMSVCLYILAALFPRNLRSIESGMKYFLLGAFATGFLLYGIAMIYGLSGLNANIGPTTQLDQLGQMIDQISGSALFYIAIALILIGFSFKIAAFPFHSWTPDVYTGAPTPMAGFMATGSKMAAFIALAQFMYHIMPLADDKIINFLALMSIVSMLYGNIVAVQQTNVKRMLAYSSIAHTGYLLLGICAGKVGYMAVIFYMVIYTFMTLGAFGVISMIEKEDEDSEMSRWKGLGMRRPWLGVAMSTFLFSLAGMPPLAGFMGKYFVFGSAIASGLYVLATIGILTSVIGAYYYLRLIVVMYFQKPGEGQAVCAPATEIHPQVVPMIGAVALMVLLIVLGMFPSLIEVSLDALFSGAGLMTSTQP
jgi:NADH-quinone oxidoreductase subunit N